MTLPTNDFDFAEYGEHQDLLIRLSHSVAVLQRGFNMFVECREKDVEFSDEYLKLMGCEAEILGEYVRECEKHELMDEAKALTQGLSTGWVAENLDEAVAEGYLAEWMETVPNSQYLYLLWEYADVIEEEGFGYDEASEIVNDAIVAGTPVEVALEEATEEREEKKREEEQIEKALAQQNAQREAEKKLEAEKLAGVGAVAVAGAAAGAASTVQIDDVEHTDETVETDVTDEIVEQEKDADKKKREERQAAFDDLAEASAAVHQAQQNTDEFEF